jgi:toxin ParE1/3/4
MQFAYSKLAEDDLTEIGAYTLQMWGVEQTEKYLRQLEDCCRMIARNPNLGKPWKGNSQGLRRMEQGSHTIFYRQFDSRIIVVRILHQNMMPTRHTFDET